MEELGKLPPQATDIEEAVLGAVLLEKNAMIEVAGYLRPEHFYLEQHQVIFQAIQLLFAASEPIDLLTVVIQLRKTGKLEIAGGAHYIATISSRVSSAANINSHARILMEMSMKRSLIHLGSEIQHDAYDDTMDVFSQIEKTNLNIQDILDNAISSKSDKTMLEIVTNVVKQVQARQTGKHSGLDSGFKVLDVMLNGFQPTDLIIIASRPGMGKTTYAIQAAKQIAERGIPIGIFSLEMSDIQLTERMIISECEIDSDIIKKGKMDEHQMKRFVEISGNLTKLPIHIDDTAFSTILEIRAKAMRMKTKYGIQFLVVDYLQLIKPSGKRGQTRDQEIGEITRTLKGIAKELNIPIIAASQLNRGLETRGGDKRPKLSDLRESGSIEQDADIVMFLYRPEYYKISVDENGYSTNGLCEVIIEKHRNGSLGTIYQKFVGKYTKFVEWTTEMKSDQSKYVKEHYKDPSQRSIESFEPGAENEDMPF